MRQNRSVIDAAFLARDSNVQSYRDVRPSQWWISQKRLKLGLRNFHRTVASSL